MTEKTVSLATIRKLAYEGSAEDFVGLLKEYGDDILTDKYDRKTGNMIDQFSAVADKTFCKEAKKKRALIAAYLGKQGAFAPRQEFPADKAEAQQKKIDELMQTARDLTARVGKTEALQQEVQALTQRVAELEENERMLTDLVGELIGHQKVLQTEAAAEAQPAAETSGKKPARAAP